MDKILCDECEGDSVGFATDCIREVDWKKMMYVYRIIRTHYFCASHRKNARVFDITGRLVEANGVLIE